MEMRTLFCLAAFLVSVSAHAASFDCKQTGTAVEKAICLDEELSFWDDLLAQAYGKALEFTNNSPELRAAQRAWLKKRNACGADFRCLDERYHERIPELRYVYLPARHPENFRYELELSHNDEVCRHMQEVYNTRFRTPWKKPWGGSEDYSQNGPFAWPKYFGVEHSTSFTIEMRHSKLPTSPEFEAIRWTEGRRSRSYGHQDTLFPFLAADFDVDNDGAMETVIKTSFMHFSDPAEYNPKDFAADRFLFYKQGSIDPAEIMPSSQLYHRTPGPRLWEATVLRPFIYNGTTYFSRYYNDYDPPMVEWDPREGTPHDNEYMAIELYLGGGGANPDKPNYRTEVRTEAICRFRMEATD